MDKPADVITSLIESGMTEQAIADQLAAFGVQVTQSTIHRIKTGEIEQPKFNVGIGLLKLRDQVKKSGVAA
jgi:hypothetical protein